MVGWLGVGDPDVGVVGFGVCGLGCGDGAWQSGSSDSSKTLIPTFLNPKPQTLNPKPPKPQHPKARKTQNPKPQTLHDSLNPKP